MSTFSSGGLTPRMMVLGLVIQQPDTVAGVARRLADEFASARFPKSSAHNNLPSLAQSGYVRLITSGEESSLDRYEATALGGEHLRQWLRASAFAPAIRDAVQGKLQFAEFEDLAAVLRVVREEEEACRHACDIAHARVLAEQRLRRRSGSSADWQVRLKAIQSKDEANLWSLMSQRLEHLREELEELLESITLDGQTPDG